MLPSVGMTLRVERQTSKTATFRSMMPEQMSGEDQSFLLKYTGTCTDPQARAHAGN